MDMFDELLKETSELIGKRYTTFKEAEKRVSFSLKNEICSLIR